MGYWNVALILALAGLIVIGYLRADQAYYAAIEEWPRWWPKRWRK